MIKVNGLSVSRIPINGKETLRVMRNGQQLWSGTGLPAGYTLLEYIESTGKQYIDTGFKPKYNSRVVMEISNIGSSAGFIFGTRDESDSNALNQFNVYRTSSGIRSDYFGTNKSATISDYTSKGIVEKNANVLNFKETIITNTPVSSGICSYNLVLFSLNTKGTINLYSSYRLYSCQIYDNGNLIRDFVPVKENNSGIFGLYDKENKKFYSSMTSIDFIGA